MNFTQYCETLYEATFKIAAKDWDRMIDLYVADKDGAAVADKIKDKNKAIARFIAGVKLDGDTKLSHSHGEFNDTMFRHFGNKALELGATVEEIQSLFDDAVIPPATAEKLANLTHKDKKMDNRFVSQLNKAIMKAGHDITYVKHNGYALTRDGKDAMERNGRKWTIGYKSIIKSADKELEFNFDAITSEGDGPTYYVVDRSSSRVFEDLYHDLPVGVTKFIANVLECIEKNTK